MIASTPVGHQPGARFALRLGVATAGTVVRPSPVGLGPPADSRVNARVRLVGGCGPESGRGAAVENGGALMGHQIFVMTEMRYARRPRQA